MWELSAIETCCLCVGSVSRNNITLFFLSRTELFRRLMIGTKLFQMWERASSFFESRQFLFFRASTFWFNIFFLQARPINWHWSIFDWSPIQKSSYQKNSSFGLLPSFGLLRSSDQKINCWHQLPLAFAWLLAAPKYVLFRNTTKKRLISFWRTFSNHEERYPCSLACRRHRWHNRLLPPCCPIPGPHWSRLLPSWWKLWLWCWPRQRWNRDR